MKKATSLRKRTGQTLRQRVASTSGDKPVTLAQGDIIRTDLMKISPDRSLDYYNLERNDWLPMHAERVKDGAVKSWSVWTFRSPAGSERMADAVTTTVYEGYGIRHGESQLRVTAFEAVSQSQRFCAVR